jgi:uracil-DNA glycosylase
MPALGDPDPDAALPGSFPASPSFGEPWRRLEEEIRACTKCPLHATRTHVVIYRGAPAPSVVFVGEAPGASEDRVGLPFVGRSGRRLDAAIAEVGLTAEQFGVLNLIKCRPPGNRFDRAAATTCRPYLDRQLALLRPRLLVPLGAHALRTLDPNAPPMLQAAGQPRESGGRVLFPLIHPAAALRSRRLAERWSHDSGALAVWLRSVEARAIRQPS